MDLGTAGISKDVQETVGYSLNTEYKLFAKMSLLVLASNTALWEKSLWENNTETSLIKHYGNVKEVSDFNKLPRKCVFKS